MTITTYTETGNVMFFKKVVSDLAAVTTPLAEIIDLKDLPSDLTHCFGSVEFFKADGTTIADPTAGNVFIRIGTLNTGGQLEQVFGTILAANPRTLSWAANTTRALVFVQGTSGDDVAFVRLTITFNLR